MKRLIVPFLLMTFCFALGREATSEKENDKDSWEKLKKVQLKTLKFTSVPNEKAFKFDMRGIKNALEKAGITEKVTIELYVEDKLFGNMGTYGPDTKATKVRFSAIPGFVKLREMPETQGILRPARPARPETIARPARPETIARPARPETIARPARPARPETIARPARPETIARPARPARPVGQAAVATAQSRSPKFGFLIFKNEAGAVMARIKVKLAGM